MTRLSPFTAIVCILLVGASPVFAAPQDADPITGAHSGGADTTKPGLAGTTDGAVTSSKADDGKQRAKDDSLRFGRSVR